MDWILFHTAVLKQRQRRHVPSVAKRFLSSLWNKYMFLVLLSNFFRIYFLSPFTTTVWEGYRGLLLHLVIAHQVQDWQGGGGGTMGAGEGVGSHHTYVVQWPPYLCGTVATMPNVLLWSPCPCDTAATWYGDHHAHVVRWPPCPRGIVAPVVELDRCSDVV